MMPPLKRYVFDLFNQDLEGNLKKTEREFYSSKAKVVLKVGGVHDYSTAITVNTTDISTQVDMLSKIPDAFNNQVFGFTVDMQTSEAYDMLRELIPDTLKEYRSPENGLVFISAKGAKPLLDFLAQHSGDLEELNIPVIGCTTKTYATNFSSSYYPLVRALVTVRANDRKIQTSIGVLHGLRDNAFFDVVNLVNSLL